LQDEIRGLLSQTDLSYDGLKKVKFLDACIKETQRYFTFLFFLREADEDCEIAGVKVALRYFYLINSGTLGG